MAELWSPAVPASAVPERPLGPPAVAGEAAPSVLRRELGRLDAMCMALAAIVVLDTLGAVATGGAQAVTWLAVAAVLFFVPAALVISELGSTLPHEGGPYVWTRLAWGRRVGSLTAFLYWVESAFWLGGSLTIVGLTVVGAFFEPLASPWRELAALAFIWGVAAVAMLPVRVGGAAARLGALVQVALLAFFTLSVALYAARHGVHGVDAADFAPSWAVFAAIGPIFVYSLIGFEVPSNAAGEMRNPQRDIPSAIARAGACTAVLYAVPILAIVVVLPTEQITGLHGFVDAMVSVFTVWGGAGPALGKAAALGFVYVLFANGLAWIMAGSRAQAVACLDGAGPRGLGLFSRHGVPARLAVLAAVVATAVMAFAFAVSGTNGEQYFAVALTCSIVLISLANVAIFAALPRLRRGAAAKPGAFRIPGRRAPLVMSALATAWVVFATASVLWPGLGGAGDAALPDGFASDRVGFTTTVATPLVAVLLAGAVWYRVGARRMD
jgi:glutamate:GABA antiporter